MVKRSLLLNLLKEIVLPGGIEPEADSIHDPLGRLGICLGADRAGPAAGLAEGTL